MTPGLLLGCIFGGSICLLLLVLVPPRRRLLTEVNRFERRRVVESGASGPMSVVATTSRFAVRPHHDRVGRWIAAQLIAHGFTLPRLRADLALVGQTLEVHLVRKCGYALAGLLVPSIYVVLLVLAGIRPPLAVPSIAAIGMAATFFWLPDLSVVKSAERRRHQLRRALSCYLDLVAMSLAGGRGLPEALPSAARIGSGWAFELLQDALDRARYTGTTPWVAFAELGERTAVPELHDLGGSLQLVADDGAKVRASLTARAASQRRRQLAEAEGAAAKADQTIQLAQVVLAVGFFLFLGYPAVVAVMGT